jgi:hypothetical protein
MDEAEWLAFDDPQPMLSFLQSKASARKLRLFAAACCRRMWRAWEVIPSPVEMQAVEMAERFADGQASDEERSAALSSLDASPVSPFQEAERGVARDTVRAAVMVVAKGAARSARVVARESTWTALESADPRRKGAASEIAERAEGQAQSVLLRCILGNPFRHVALSASGRTPTVLALAQAAYDDRALPAGTLDAARLAVLADALEDAGCADPDILGHLRGPGPHVRGCWALDLILGRQ